MEGTSLLRGDASPRGQSILPLIPNRLGDLQTEKQFMNMLLMYHLPFPNKPQLPVVTSPSRPRRVRAKGFRGGNLGFSMPWSAEGSCLTWSLSLWLPCRTSHSRAKAEAAVTAAQKAQEEARIARITAKEFSPSFQHRENGQCVPPCWPAPWRRLYPRAALCPTQTCRDPKPPKMSPAGRLGLCPQLLVLTRTLRVGNCPVTPAFGGFSTRLSIFNTSTLCNPVITGISSFHTKALPFFLIRSP